MVLWQHLSARFFIKIAFLVLLPAILITGYVVLLRLDDTSLTKPFVLKQIGVFASNGIPCQRHATDAPPSSSWPLVPTLRRLFPAHNDIHHTSFRPTFFACPTAGFVRMASHPCATPTDHASLHALVHFPADIPTHLYNSAGAPSDFYALPQV